MNEGYRSIAREATVTIERKKSRFIGIAIPVQSLTDAEKAIEQARLLYPDATHHCYAFRAGLEGTVVRFSDDKEPQGTAGRPILEVLERNELENTCVVVVRYFGGTQLGAAGLTRAYRAAATEAVSEAGMAQFERHAVFEGAAPYADWAKVERLFHQMDVSLIDTSFQELVRFTGTIATSDVERLRHALKDESAGAVEIVTKDFTFAPSRFNP